MKISEDNIITDTSRYWYFDKNFLIKGCRLLDFVITQINNVTIEMFQENSYGVGIVKILNRQQVRQFSSS